MDVFIVPLPINGRIYPVQYSGFRPSCDNMFRKRIAILKYLLRGAEEWAFAPNFDFIVIGNS
jgi:hypothetical protein